MKPARKPVPPMTNPPPPVTDLPDDVVQMAADAANVALDDELATSESVMRAALNAVLPALRQSAYDDGLRAAAAKGYATCAGKRHGTLGDAVAEAILALIGHPAPDVGENGNG